MDSMSSPRLHCGRHSSLGNVYAVTTICRHRAPLFLDPTNPAIIRKVIASVDARGVTSTFAWVAMPDHLHWLFQLLQGSLAQCMQSMKGVSSLQINRQRGGGGAIWQPGYHDHVVRADASLHKHARYILANPIRAGLATTFGEYPHAWCRWPLEEIDDPRHPLCDRRR